MAGNRQTGLDLLLQGTHVLRDFLRNRVPPLRTRTEEALANQQRVTPHNVRRLHSLRRSSSTPRCRPQRGGNSPRPQRAADQQYHMPGTPITCNVCSFLCHSVESASLVTHSDTLLLSVCRCCYVPRPLRFPSAPTSSETLTRCTESTHQAQRQVSCAAAAGGAASPAPEPVLSPLEQKLAAAAQAFTRLFPVCKRTHTDVLRIVGTTRNSRGRFTLPQRCSLPARTRTLAVAPARDKRSRFPTRFLPQGSSWPPSRGSTNRAFTCGSTPHGRHGDSSSSWRAWASHSPSKYARNRVKRLWPWLW